MSPQVEAHHLQSRRGPILLKRDIKNGSGSIIYSLILAPFGGQEKKSGELTNIFYLRKDTFFSPPSVTVK